jgi:hypothetical protein
MAPETHRQGAVCEDRVRSGRVPTLIDTDALVVTRDC